MYTLFYSWDHIYHIVVLIVQSFVYKCYGVMLAINVSKACTLHNVSVMYGSSAVQCEHYVLSHSPHCNIILVCLHHYIGMVTAM